MAQQETASAAPIRINAVGALQVFARSGEKIRVSGQRPAALLALLALSPEMRRSRSWLQDHLWSLSDAQRGSGNLRQTLTVLRGLHPDLRAALVSDRVFVGLNPALISLDLNDDALAAPDGVELLEGLDVPDPEFEDWLRDQRAAFEDRMAGAPRAEPAPRRKDCLTLVISRRETGARESDRALEMISDWIAKSASESGPVRVVEADDILNRRGVSMGRPGSSLVAVFDSYRVDGALGVQVKLRSALDGRLVWTGMRKMEADAHAATEETAIMQLANQTVDAMASGFIADVAAAGDDRRAATLCYQAIQRIFRYDAASADEADKLLEEAFAAEPCGIYLAWRAFLRLTQHVECWRPEDKGYIAEADVFARRALEMDPLNSTVVAIASQALIIAAEEIFAGYELANRSVSLNPSNPLGWASLASASVRLGRTRDAHLLGRKARQLAASSPFFHWWNMLCCITSAVGGDIDSAIYNGEVAHGVAPGYKPPLRYLSALYLQAGKINAARGAVSSLQRLEKDFCIGRLLSDAYPVASLRETKIIDAVQKAQHML